MGMRKCCECGRMYDAMIQGGGNYSHTMYCSDKCYRSARAATAAKNSSRGYSGSDVKSLLTVLKIIGIVFIALATVGTALFYKFPKFLYGKNKKFLYAYIITWVVLIAGTVVYFSFFSPEAVSGIKIKTVSTSCETEEQFVSIIKEALSEVSATTLEGEEFTTYAQQARDAVTEREFLFKDAVYFMGFPDNVNVYIWFKTKDQAKAHVYKTE